MQETQLDHAISAIRVRFGSQALTRADELPPPQPWPSGTPLDRLTGIGGLPRGRLTLLSGSGTCGKLTLALALLAGATHAFAHAVVVDIRESRQSPLSFDPWALLPFDPELNSLTVIRPSGCDQAGEAASTLAKAGAGFILLMGEVPEPWLGPLEAGAGRSGTVVIGVVEAPGRAFAHASSLTLGFSRTEWVFDRGQLVGLRIVARCLKNRVAPPIGESALEIRYPIHSLPLQGGGLGWGSGAGNGHPIIELPDMRTAQLDEQCTSAVV